MSSVGRRAPTTTHFVGVFRRVWRLNSILPALKVVFAILLRHGCTFHKTHPWPGMAKTLQPRTHMKYNGRVGSNKRHRKRFTRPVPLQVPPHERLPRPRPHLPPRPLHLQRPQARMCCGSRRARRAGPSAAEARLRPGRALLGMGGLLPARPTQKIHEAEAMKRSTAPQRDPRRRGLFQNCR